MKRGELFVVKQGSTLWDAEMPLKSSSLGSLFRGGIGVILRVNSTYRHQGIEVLVSDGRRGWLHGEEIETIR